MLVRYRFNFTNATEEEKRHIHDQLDKYGYTGEIIVASGISDAFFEETENPLVLIPLPEGCTVQKTLEP